MLELRSIVLASCVATCALAVAGCGGSDDGSVMSEVKPVPTAACPLYSSSADLTTPVVSFKSDVMPVFHTSCQSSTCHGSATSPEGGLFLGAALADGSDAATVHAGLVGKKSGELPGMEFIASGGGDDATANSYLMHKLDGDQCVFASSCAGGDCLALMPDDEGVLPVATRDTIRRWIFQGALSN